jgi:CO/xanthine dehydrogenase Mo-binding subunit
MVSAVDAGRILNEKLARSQIIGAVVMGIGMTLVEETIFDSATGRIANAVYHATGRRIRSLPITIEQLL